MRQDIAEAPIKDGELGEILSKATVKLSENTVSISLLRDTTHRLTFSQPETEAQLVELRKKLEAILGDAA